MTKKIFSESICRAITLGQKEHFFLSMEFSHPFNIIYFSMNIPGPNFAHVRKMSIGSKELISVGTPWSDDWEDDQYEVYDTFCFHKDVQYYQTPMFERPIPVQVGDIVRLDILITGYVPDDISLVKNECKLHEFVGKLRKGEKFVLETTFYSSNSNS